MAACISSTSSVVGVSPVPIAQTGSRIVHLGRITDEYDTFDEMKEELKDRE